MEKPILIILIIFLLLFGQYAFAETDNGALLQQINDKEAEIKKLEIELNKYKGILSTTQNQSNTLKNQITLIETQINKLKIDLKITQAKISKTESNIKLYSEKITEKEKKIWERQSAMAQSLRLLEYVDGTASLAFILLSSNKFSDFLNQNEYITTIEGGLYGNFKILYQAKQELEGFLFGQKELKIELNDLKKELQSKTKAIEIQKQEKGTILKETKNQEALYKKIISQIQIKQASIQKEIFELENKLRGEVGNIPQPRPGILAWPIFGGRISQGYGPTSVTGFYNDAYKFHNGIDIAALDYGAPVIASLDGIISSSGDDGRYAYGKWLTIRHDNGLTTLYAHFSHKNVNIGESVRQGQVIGYEGSTGFVTGPHLHFTVYSTNTFHVESRWFGLLPLGGSINPLNYLFQ